MGRQQSRARNHMHAYAVLATQLGAARLATGITQTELGDRIGHDQSFVSKVEGQARRLDVVEFVQITNALRVDPLSIIAAVSNALRQEN